MGSWFCKKGYLKGQVEKEICKINFSGYTKRNVRETKEVPLVIAHHSSLKNIWSIITQKVYILYMNEEVKIDLSNDYFPQCEKNKQLFSQSKTLLWLNRSD